MKRDIQRLEMAQEAIADLLNGLNGKPFVWGDSEHRAKEGILASLGFALVTITKLTRGGHELKRGVKPVGKAYFGSPIRKYAELYVLGVQTKRTLKWSDLWGRGKALLEGTHQWGQREEYGWKRDPTPVTKAQPDDGAV